MSKRPAPRSTALPDHAADRNLLFGILALQMDFVSRDALIAAMGAWALEKHRPLGEILVGRGDLEPRFRALLGQMVEAHLERHAGDPRASLAALGSAESAAAVVRGSVADPEVRASLDPVGSDRSGDLSSTRGPAPSDPAGPVARFRKVREHAAGNLGVVYVARDEELNREVALKEINERNADHLHSRAKFLLEAEVTGGLEHPGIVPVYGLGRHPDGRPYYAMRFIRGRSLLEAVRRFHDGRAHDADPGRRLLALQGLLRRFTDVCDAVAYAHSRGILHRDLKPDNVMVGRYGETLVVDWGLAKPFGVAAGPAAVESVDEPLPEATLRPSTADTAEATQAGSLVGTPAYMSPEQASGRLDLLGPASDVYGLGATLFHLLVGRPPVQAATLSEALEKIRGGDIPRPRSLVPWLDSALEAICLKALALKPEGRYPTARALAEDLDRWMAGEAVAAFAEPWSRRALRWARRHRTSVAAAASALLIALVGLAIVQVLQARTNRDLAVKNGELAGANRRAEARFEVARDAIGSLQAAVTQDEMLKDEELAGLRNKLLRTVAGFYERLEPLLQDQGDRRARALLARSYDELGRLTLDIGGEPEAMAAHRKALSIRRQLNGSPGSGPDEARDVARSLIAVGNIAKRAGIGDKKGSTEAFEEARAIAERLIAADPHVAEYQDILAESLVGSGIAMIQGGRPVPDEAVDSFRLAASIRERLAAADPGLAWNQRALAEAYHQLGLAEDQNRNTRPDPQPAKVSEYYGRALAIQERLARAHPDVLEYQLDQATTLNNIGNVLAEGDGRSGEALEHHRRALEYHRRAAAILKRLASANAAATKIQLLLAADNGNMARLHELMNDRPAALAMLRMGQPILDRLAAAHPYHQKYQRIRAYNLRDIGSLMARMGDTGGAGEALGRSLALFEELAKEDPSDAWSQGAVAITFYEIGRAAAASGRYAEAVAAHRRAVSIQRRIAGSPDELYNLACCQSLLAGAARRPGSGLTANEARAEEDAAVAALRRAIAAGYRDLAHMKVDADLDPIRARPDARALMLDLAFPKDPFASR